MAFHNDIALKQVQNGVFQTDIIEDYWIIVGPNGGYLGALLANAGDIHLGAGLHQLRGMTIHYLSPPKLGPVEIRVDIIRSGRSVTFLRFEMHQNLAVVLVATGSWASTGKGLESPQIPIPSVPSPQACPEPTQLTESPTRLHEKWEIRSVNRAMASPLTPSVAEMTWWVRPKDPTPISSALLVATADALPPPIFFQSDQIKMAPTIDLTIHIRASLQSTKWNAGDWMLAHFVTNHASEGFIEEDGLVWSEEGTLLCMSRQLALAR
jgi:acyl-CoA thioesterase